MITTSPPTDLDIAQGVSLKPITKIANKPGLDPEEIEMYGGLEHLPVCIVKTQKSLSDDPQLLGGPVGFTLNVMEIEIAAGAGFLMPIIREMMRTGLTCTSRFRKYKY